MLGDLSESGLHETRALIKENTPEAVVEIYELDVGDETAVESFVALAIGKFGRIDYAVNIAGYSHPALPSIDITEDEFDRCFNVNLKGVHNMGTTRVGLTPS